MRKLRWFVCFALLIAVHSAGVAATLHFEQNGFTINALEGTSDITAYQVLVMSLPPTPDGFSPNVNILVQPLEGTFDAYVAQSKQEIEALGLVTLDVTVSDAERATFEYVGEMFDMRLRWYVKAVSTEDKVYLITAAGSLDYWSEISEALIDTVESFQLDESK